MLKALALHRQWPLESDSDELLNVQKYRWCCSARSVRTRSSSWPTSSYLRWRESWRWRRTTWSCAHALADWVFSTTSRTSGSTSSTPPWQRARKSTSSWSTCAGWVDGCKSFEVIDNDLNTRLMGIYHIMERKGKCHILRKKRNILFSQQIPNRGWNELLNSWCNE